MQKYRSHKIVEAGKISAVEFSTAAEAKIALVGGEMVTSSGGWKARFHGDDDDLGYFVRYEDGYESWSPTKAFEEGYTVVE